MPNSDNNTLKYNHGEKSLKVPWVIYADFECLSIKQQSYLNNPNDSYTERKDIHETCGQIQLAHLIQIKINIEESFYRGKDCTKKFSKELKEYSSKIINFKEKDMIPLTDEEIEFYEKQKYVTYLKKSFVIIKMKKINLNYIKKLEIIATIPENLENLLIVFVI